MVCLVVSDALALAALIGELEGLFHRREIDLSSTKHVLAAKGNAESFGLDVTHGPDHLPGENG